MHRRTGRCKNLRAGDAALEAVSVAHDLAAATAGARSAARAAEQVRRVPSSFPHAGPPGDWRREY